MLQGYVGVPLENVFFVPTSEYSLIVHNNKYPTRKRIHLPPREKENLRLKSASWDGIWTRSLWRVSEKSENHDFWQRLGPCRGRWCRIPCKNVCPSVATGK